MRGSLRVVVVKLLLFAAVTLSMTGLLAAVIGNIQPFVGFYEVKATFSDATGLLRSDVVKVAGVVVGKVTGAEVRGATAVVTMQIRKDVSLPATGLRAAIRFRNLVGQRMVVLLPDPAAPPRPTLRERPVIPLERTSPALDLAVVFNNLRPVLASLNPEDANVLSRAVVQIFAGREARLQRMVANLADLAQSLGQRGSVAAELVSNLNKVVLSLLERDRELQSVLSSFDTVLGALAARSEELARAAETLGVASNGTADLIAANRQALDDTIRRLSEILDLVERHKADVDATLRQLPRTTLALNKATTYGEWTNLFIVCVNNQGCPTRPPASVTARPARPDDILLLPLEVGR